jgi:hypothetical protein
MNIIDIAVNHLNEKGKDACIFKNLKELSTDTLQNYKDNSVESMKSDSKNAGKRTKGYTLALRKQLGPDYYKQKKTLSGGKPNWRTKPKVFASDSPGNVKEEVINETLSASASSSDYIDDFVHSDDPRFNGDSKQKRIRRALGAYYGKKHSVKEQNAVEPLIGEDGKKKIKETRKQKN